ncbi:pyrroline-5-carboxylate reductase [Desulfonatronovibrio magnus]|uniref:pyrroline-5-carboxylate reductase n=1 Tax=Desulfonatronovibrio magnus TaxID=698827 RepID=UPI0005EB79B1|nr:pyrroline-5-carboxylate reductase [Desulfonatronovibrio magnus]
MTISIGFIGAGNMGGAMIAGLAPGKDLQIHVFDPDQDRVGALVQKYGIQAASTPMDVADKSSYIFYAVKPGLMKSVIQQTLPLINETKCILSIAAGVQIRNLILWSDNKCPVVRIMPNTPALVDRGVFALCLEHSLLGSDQKDLITALLNRLGQTFILPEKSFDAFTGLIGSGPAYVFYFMESMVEAGVLEGLDRKTTTAMVRELFAGSAQMTFMQDTCISGLREMVTSPGGTTIQGLKTLDKRAVRAAIMEAVEKATQKSAELGRDS